MSALTEGRRGLRLQTSRLARMPRRWRLCSFSPRRTLVNARTRSETTRPRCLSHLVNGHTHESMHTHQTFTYLGITGLTYLELFSHVTYKVTVRLGGVSWRAVQSAHMLACSHAGVLWYVTLISSVCNFVLSG